MHWFWITWNFYGILCNETTTSQDCTVRSSKSALEDTKELTTLQNKLENSTFALTPSTNITENSSNAPISFKKGSKYNKKVESMKNLVAKTNDTNKPPKQLTVIIQNVTDKYENLSKIEYNSNLTAINQSNILFSNETNTKNDLYSQQILQEYEDISSDNFSAAGITGITMACVVVVGLVCAVSYFLYRNRGFIRPQVLNDHCSNPDSSGYLDDASVRDNSEEMYSLDNDSFLNSLEAMTIQNYWTDTVKHTKL